MLPVALVILFVLRDVYKRQDLEDAVKALWKAGIYAESGMGCTGPIVLLSLIHI